MECAASFPARSRSRLAIATLCTAAVCSIAPATEAAPPDDAFYHQLLKMRTPAGYQPTRTFTIVIDTENGNQLVAEDDAHLRFNLLWMQQFQPGYKARHGGSAFGEIFRSYVKTAYKSYRDSNAQSMAALPDENGSVKSRSFARDVDYNLKVTDDEVRFKVEYSY